MLKGLKSQIGAVILTLLTLSMVVSSRAWGENEVSGLPLEGDPEIFPFAEAETGILPSDLRYSETLYDITDQGVRDPQGNLVQTLPAIPSLPTDPLLTSEDDKPALPGASESQSALEEYQASIIANWGGKKAFTEKRLTDIKKSLEEENKTFEKLGKKIRHLEKAMIPIQKQKDTLADEIDLLNQQLIESKNKIRAIEFQIAEKQISLKDLMLELQTQEAELSIQRDVVLDYILLIYREDEKFRGLLGNGSSTLKLLLADNSVSENLLGQEYVSILGDAGREVFYKLHQKKLVLEDNRYAIETRQAELEILNLDLNHERIIVEENRQSKQELLEKTQGVEEKYQQLLEESLKQQLESAISIQNMQENIEYIEEKLKLLDDSLETLKTLPPEAVQPAVAPEAEQKVESPESTDHPIIPDEPAVQPRLFPFSWPLNPERGISSYFEDPTYPKRWGIHKAIDIRVKQFSEIYAPANAYVFQAKDNGKGYSYIILAHKNKFVTVYGHVTEIRVKTGDVVKEGDLIGLSGGTPGTKGAGWQTTGPHLHFEVWHNGEQVDPLNFLPIQELPIEYIPDRFLTQLGAVGVGK